MARSSRHSKRSSAASSKSRPRAGYRKPANQVQGDSEKTPTVELALDGLAYDGRGVGRYQGRACFVEGGLKGETVKAQITAANNKRVEAKLIKIIEPSLERAQPKCNVYQRCGGCDLQHLSHDAQIVHKQQVVEQMLARNADITSVQWNDAVAPQRETLGYDYRRKIRLACYYDRSKQQLTMGFRQAKSKKIIEVSECQIVTPELRTLLGLLYGLMDDLHQLESSASILSGFAHIECVADQSGMSVCFRLMKTLPVSWQDLLKQWAERHDIQLWSRIADGVLIQEQGAESSTDLLGSFKLTYSPEDFLQVNDAVNQQTISEVIQQLSLTDQDRVLDLFSGLGNFSIPAAAVSKEVLAVEAVDVMILKAQKNAEINSLSNLTVEQQDLFDPSALSWLDVPVDKVILDPPRAGAELMAENLGRTNAEIIAYVSCNPLSLARDSKLILAQGYRLESLTLLDMFPQTSHIETLAVFKQSSHA